MKDFRPKPKTKERAPGELPENRIPIFDHKGNMRGHVTKGATEATVARFIGRPGATLQKRDGRHAWVADVPPPPPPPEQPPGMPPMEAARGEAEIGLIKARTQAITAKQGGEDKAKAKSAARGSAKPRE